jgi:hypothetical protein
MNASRSLKDIPLIPALACRINSTAEAFLKRVRLSCRMTDGFPSSLPGVLNDIIGLLLSRQQQGSTAGPVSCVLCLGELSHTPTDTASVVTSYVCAARCSIGYS